jgi:protein CpxP
MKKLLLVALLAIGVSTVSLAQGPQSPEEELAGLKTSLTLSDAQVAKAKIIVDAQAKSRDSLFQAANGDFQSAIPKMMTMMTTSSAKIKALLTPEQATIYQKQLDARAEMMKRFQQGQN